MVVLQSTDAVTVESFAGVAADAGKSLIVVNGSGNVYYVSDAAGSDGAIDSVQQIGSLEGVDVAVLGADNFGATGPSSNVVA